MKRLTPILNVDRIEPCLPFWTGLGLTLTVSVPHGDALGFAMLQNDDVELMYQTRDSVRDDLAHVDEATLNGISTLYVEVGSLDDVLPALAHAPVVVERRRTFYGMDEIFVRAPCGTLVGFAARVAQP